MEITHYRIEKEDMYIVYNLKTKVVVRTFQYFGMAIARFITQEKNLVHWLNRTHPAQKELFESLIFPNDVRSYVGKRLYGYCEGYFGRNFDYDSFKRIEAIGKDWVIIRSEDGFPYFTYFDTEEEMKACLERWGQEESEEEE